MARLPPVEVKGSEGEKVAADDADTMKGVIMNGGGQLRVLYVFAGRARDGDIRAWIRDQAEGRAWELDGYDLLRSRKQDLSKAKLRTQTKDKVANTFYD